MLTDPWGRQFPYLRLSIVDACNFKCQYCLPHGTSQLKKDYLTLAELTNLLPACVELGVKKIRLTGGEPTIRKDFTEIVALIASFPQITTRAVTTNGLYLAKNAQAWRAAGLNHLNISIDSLQPQRFKTITGRDSLLQILAGVAKAIEVGFAPIKINTVLLKDLNVDEFYQFLSWVKDKPVTIRFIELMETGDNKKFFTQQHVRSTSWQNILLKQGWLSQVTEAIAGPAKVFSHPDYHGKVGFISPYADHFCFSCNRFRISATGNLHLCLFGNAVYSLRHLLQNPADQAELVAQIRAHFRLKKPSHYLQQGDFGITKHLASIGG